ncbi:hypothetical protein BGLA2_2050003 [Burkholderia gladioli]|nr:hypothetical protein BGLA2_2050003 [Burkholderia gladioli]
MRFNPNFLKSAIDSHYCFREMNDIFN